MNRKKKFSKSEKSLELDESEEQLISDEKFYRKFLIASGIFYINILQIFFRKYAIKWRYLWFKTPKR